jgi:ubiquinone biosynthesis protein COQ4
MFPNSQSDTRSSVASKLSSLSKVAVAIAQRLAERRTGGFASGVRRRRVRDAFGALATLLGDPNDTAQGFVLLEALDPHVHERELELMRRAPHGAALLRDRPELLDTLRDRATLDALPPGSLGRAYRAFCESEGLAPEGFVQIGESGSCAGALENELERYAARRHRDSHDLWHVVYGCRTDLIGEAGILGFTAAQTCSPGLALLWVGGLLHSFAIEWKQGVAMRRFAFLGLLRGLQAEPLAGVPWESWLARPLAEVRAELNVNAAPSYLPSYHVSKLRSARGHYEISPVAAAV